MARASKPEAPPSQPARCLAPGGFFRLSLETDHDIFPSVKFSKIEDAVVKEAKRRRQIRETMLEKQRAAATLAGNRRKQLIRWVWLALLPCVLTFPLGFLLEPILGEKHTGRSLLALALFWVALSTLMILRALSCWPLKYRIGVAVGLFPALAILNWLFLVIISITVDQLW